MALIRNTKFLWALQILLAALFVFAGLAKLSMTPAQLEAQGPLSATFLRFISVCELLGAVGLIVPQLTGIKPQLTRLAAIGLMIIMIGATVVTLMWPPAQGGQATAVFPFAVGVLLGVVVFGRLRQASSSMMM